MIALIAEAVATVLSLVGLALITYQCRAGWLVWIVADALWTWLLLKRKVYGAAVLFAVYTALAVWGWWMWGR